MNTWKCIAPYIGFTMGQVYKESRDGCLIDNDGDVRLRASRYRGGFVKVIKNLENK